MARPEKMTTQDVLHRATELFWKKGSDAVSTRDLETALGLRAPAIYRRFESKGILLARCIDHYVDEVVEPRVVRALDEAPDPLVGLKRFFLEMLRPHGCEPRLRGCLLTNTVAHRKPRGPELDAALTRGFDVIRQAIQRQIQRAIDQGQINKTSDPIALTKALFMSLQGLLVLSRAGETNLDTGIEATFQLLDGSLSNTNRDGSNRTVRTRSTSQNHSYDAD